MLKEKINKINNLIGGGLVKKFIIWIVLITLLLGALTTIFVQISLTKTLSEELRERGQVISRSLATSSVESILIEDTVNLHRLVENIKKSENDVKYIYIADAKGKVLAHTFEGGFPGELLTVNTGIGSSSRLLDTGDGYVIDFTAPILGGRAGSVHIGMDETSMQEKITKTSHVIIILTLLVGVIGVLMAYIAGNYLTRPIRALVKGAEEIGRGNLGYQIELGSTDEIYVLSKAFNRMSYNLNNRQKEMVKLEKQLLQSEKLATLGKLAAGVAHEINNPLTSISLHTQIMLKKVEDDNTKNRLKIIYKETNRASHIVKGLLEFARQSEPKLNTVNINKEIDVVLNVLDPQLNGTKVTTNLKPLPLVMADREQIQQVIMNMLTNSIQSITADGKIIIKTTAKHDHIEISITDNGCGIPQDNIVKIFDPFFTTKMPGKGTGLGLSICYGIIKKHNGSIDVKSEVGKGTTFTIKLPI